jgi:hypothetical protein
MDMHSGRHPIPRLRIDDLNVDATRGEREGLDGDGSEPPPPAVVRQSSRWDHLSVDDERGISRHGHVDVGARHWSLAPDAAPACDRVGRPGAAAWRRRRACPDDLAKIDRNGAMALAAFQAAP